MTGLGRSTKKVFRENSSGGPATEDQLGRLEQLAGHALPEDYRSYLLTSPGALPQKTDFWLQHPDAPWIESVADMDNVDELLRSWEVQRLNIDSGIMDYPDGLWPIGGNGCGDYFMISFRSDSRGHVFHRYHEGTGEDPEDMEGYFEIGTSFTEWIEGLRDLAND